MSVQATAIITLQTSSAHKKGFDLDENQANSYFLAIHIGLGTVYTLKNMKI